jgi:hypothetical protein
MIVFALKLLNNKYYVSSTHNIYSTLNNIFKGIHKDPWLTKNKPLYVHIVVDKCYLDEEYKYLIKYIRLYGVKNVNGPLLDSFTYEKESLREIKNEHNKK